MTTKDVANRLSRLFDERSLRSYVYWKVRTDPAYAAVLPHLSGDHPILDLGCGVGVLPFFLREHGLTAPILGIDHDERKIEAARRAAAAYRDVEFRRGDAREPLPPGHNVIVLDVLQYFEPADQQRILTNIAAAVPENGVAIFRQGIRDRSWRHRVTRAVDAFARASRWMRAEKLNFPAREQLTAAFEGFEETSTPLWGRTPFNNYLFVFRRR
ncbi:MAG TPA: class I SAM-dependent methyltransferase [Thermoanaerobaculia bacterium]|nr:class I SAM-dependent methyltransferase [Thermoanaerobaculia bacterium]